MKSSVYLRIQANKSQGKTSKKVQDQQDSGIMPHNTSLKRFPSDYSSYVQALSQGKH